MIVEVACPIPIFKTFDYELTIPPDSSTDRWVGRRVKIPFGFKFQTGIICAVKASSDTPVSKLKTVKQMLDEEPLLDASLIELGRWLAHRYACSLGEALFSLLPSGFKPTEETPMSFSSMEPDFLAPMDLRWTADQEKAVERLHEAVHGGGQKRFLLFGVAAAGKTDVYMAAIRAVLNQGRTALYLAPEIGLAAQAAALLRQRFGERTVGFWHSGLPVREQKEQWWKAKRGDVSLVVGPRSASLAPLSNLGLIVVDEEHDPFYKEERKPRFHARDVAQFRVQQNNAVLLMGSATPSLETFHATREGRIELLRLQERAVSAAAPVVKVIDLKSEKRRGALSESLRRALGERLKKQQQAILFLNRRGFYRFSLCSHCGWVAKCPNCHIALTAHTSVVPAPLNESNPAAAAAGLAAKGSRRKKGKPVKRVQLRCHYCSAQMPVPPVCPQCSQEKIFSGGYGTERLSEEVLEAFPWARVVRWDADAAKAAGGHHKIYEQLKSQGFDVLIGTQVVAQGLHLPDVTLVGVVDADSSLHLPDFRAAERAYQLITQLAGRAGRHLMTGEVLIQTRSADHYALRSAVERNYENFASVELQHRSELCYPPFGHLVLVLTQNRQTDRAAQDAQRIIDWASQLPINSPVGILGPSEAVRVRKKSENHFKILFKVPAESVDIFLTHLPLFLSQQPGRFWIDVDPESLH